ncbi:MAG: hypothetical protein ACYCUK_23205, partial [Thiomonas sp.]
MGIGTVYGPHGQALAGVDVADLPPDVARALGIVQGRSPAGVPGGLWLPPRYVPGGQAPAEFVPTSNFPQTVFQAVRLYVTANQGVFGGRGWRVPANGTVVLSGAVDTASTFIFTVNGGIKWIDLNGGTALTAGAAGGPFPIPVVSGQSIDFSVSASGVVQNLVVLYTASVTAAGGGGGSSGGSTAPTSASAPTAVTVGTSATRLDSGLSNRTSIVVINNGTASIYLGFGSVSSSLTTSNGIPLAASGGALTLPMASTVAVYGISGT